MTQFSKNLRFLRKANQFNQEDISRLFNKKANTAGNWENGKSEPSLTELLVLAGFFKVNAHELLLQDLEELTSKTYSRQEHKAPFAPTEPAIPPGGSDGIWLLIKEIRALSEKVDLLLSGQGSPGIKRNSDKSSY